MEAGKFPAARPDARPDDADILHRGEDAVPSHGESEGVDAGVVDGGREGVLDLVAPVGSDLAEECEGDVGVLGGDTAEPTGVGESSLCVCDRIGQSVEVDADEQSHTGCRVARIINRRPSR